MLHDVDDHKLSPETADTLQNARAHMEKKGLDKKMIEKIVDAILELVAGSFEIDPGNLKDEDMFPGAGYNGLLVLVDELVNIYKIPNSITRQYNYEKILTMYNDTLQGKAKYIGIIMGGTPQCIEDTRRGVYSYEALRSRLAEGRFGREGMKDMLAPVIHLSPLNYEEMLVLTEKLADIHAQLFEYQQMITQEEMISFIQLEFSRIGSDSHITPREVIRDFIELLDIVYQNPQINISELISSGTVISSSAADTSSDDEEFAEFEI